MKYFLPFLLAPVSILAADFSPKIERVDPSLNQLLAVDAPIEKLAEGFDWSEGPVWFQGSVVFSDVPENIIYQWKPGETKAAIFMKPSREFTGEFVIDDSFLYGEGERDFDKYAVDPKSSLMRDFFVPDDMPPPPGVTIGGAIAT